MTRKALKSFQSEIEFLNRALFTAANVSDLKPNQVEAFERLSNFIDREFEPIWYSDSKQQSGDNDYQHNARFWKQTDNFTQPDRTCYSSTCAMGGNFYYPDVITSDDMYLKRVLSIGDTTVHDVQTEALQSFGIETEFIQGATLDDLLSYLREGHVVGFGFKHRGSLQAPFGGHWALAVGEYAGGIYVHDPYGELPYTQPADSGKYAKYPWITLEHRWSIDPGNTGWIRIFGDAVN